MAFDEVAEIRGADGRFEPQRGAFEGVGFRGVAFADAGREHLERAGEIRAVHRASFQGRRLEADRLVGIGRGGFGPLVGNKHRTHPEDKQSGRGGDEQKADEGSFLHLWRINNGDLRIDLARPEIDAAGEAPGPFTTVFAQEDRRVHRAHPVVAIDDDGTGIVGPKQFARRLLAEAGKGISSAPSIRQRANSSSSRQSTRRISADAGSASKAARSAGAIS